MAPIHSKLEADEIRLLVLHDSHEAFGRDQIQCTLKVVKRWQAPKYEARSYTWVDGALRKEMKVNGQNVEITRNLHDFLWRLRRSCHGYCSFPQVKLPCHSHPERVVWVDALCISQTDIAEKSQQVARIGTIFSSAEQVLAWLGPHADGSELLVRDNLELNQGWVQTICRFLEREYWKRTWILQEIVMARRVEIYCGRDHLDWEALEETINPKSYARYDDDDEQQMRDEQKWQDIYQHALSKLMIHLRHKGSFLLRKSPG